VFQHLEYFPFGETWVEEKSNTQRTPYLFTGKELDEDTGLYYFGARYYDQRTSVWVSVDPILEKYLPTGDKEKDGKLPGMGGVFSTTNLNLYHYAGLNPVKYTDPDGKEKLIWVSPSVEKDKTIYAGATNDKNSDPKAVNVYAHANPQIVAKWNSKKRLNANDLVAALRGNSVLVQQKQKTGDKNVLTIILNSCNTAKQEDTTSPVAQQLSKKLGPEYVVIGATRQVFYNRDGVLGPGEWGENKRYKEAGEWNVYQDGKLIKQFGPDWNPTAMPNNPILRFFWLNQDR